MEVPKDLHECIDAILAEDKQSILEIKQEHAEMQKENEVDTKKKCELEAILAALDVELHQLKPYASISAGSSNNELERTIRAVQSMKLSDQSTVSEGSGQANDTQIKSVSMDTSQASQLTIRKAMSMNLSKNSGTLVKGTGTASSLDMDIEANFSDLKMSDETRTQTVSMQQSKMIKTSSEPIDMELAAGASNISSKAAKGPGTSSKDSSNASQGELSMEETIRGGQSMATDKSVAPPADDAAAGGNSTVDSSDEDESPSQSSATMEKIDPKYDCSIEEAITKGLDFLKEYCAYHVKRSWKRLEKTEMPYEPIIIITAMTPDGVYVKCPKKCKKDIHLNRHECRGKVSITWSFFHKHMVKKHQATMYEK